MLKKGTLLSLALRRKTKKTKSGKYVLQKCRKSKVGSRHIFSSRFQPSEQPQQEDAEEKQEDESFSLRSSSEPLNHGIQPLGNLYFSPNPVNSRNQGLGALHILTDELILDVLGFVGATDLGTLSIVSKSFYIFANQEALWRNLVLNNLKKGFTYNKSWKSTYICSYFHSFLTSPRPHITIRNFYSDYLFQSWLCANLEMKPEWLERDNIARKRGISLEEFISHFEEPNKPVLLEGCIDDWPAIDKWNREYLLKKCGECKFAAGPISMNLREYFAYSDQANEERPLYLFDPNFIKKVPSLNSDYEPPIFFREDLFSVLGDERPDYRWIIIGPARSGSSFHIDPNSTSAWNAVIKGSKKWVLFPPDVVPPGVFPSADGADVACPVSIVEWFMNFYSSAMKWKKRPIECICRAGEVVFVPRGWWHMVVNLEDSIAITQNYVSWRNLLSVLEFLKRPNAEELVSGTRDRVNLYEKFEMAVEDKYPGAIESLRKKKEYEEKKKPSLSFWDSVMDSNAGAFQFGL